jgi:hypothetical protein
MGVMYLKVNLTRALQGLGYFDEARPLVLLYQTIIYDMPCARAMAVRYDEWSVVP